MRLPSAALLALLALACAAAPASAPSTPSAPPTKAGVKGSRAGPSPSAVAVAAEPDAGAPPVDLAAGLEELRFDPPPPATTRGRHYFTSNERSPELFREAVRDLGGVVTGVGAEQMYLLAGWARADVLVLTDFDDWIVDLHEVYATLFLEHERVEDFLKAWEYRSRKQVEAALERRFPEQETRWRKVRAFGAARAEVLKRLTDLKRRFAKSGTDSFLSERGQYDHLRDLWRTGRARALRADLTQDRALPDLARFAQSKKLSVRVLYLSNAEDYFSFDTRSYKANVLAQPFDEKSVVLRTRPYKGSEYEYVVQPGLGFQAWLRSGAPNTMCELVRYATQKRGDLYELQAEPGAPPARKYLCE